MSETIPEQPNLAVELDVPARYEIAKGWALAAKQVAETAQDDEALMIWSFINSRTAIGVASPLGGVHYFFTYEPERPIEEYAFLTPIVEADIMRLPETDFRRQMAEGKLSNAAQYNEGSRAIYLPPLNFGILGKGILLQHEAMHAWLDLEKKINRDAKDSHWLEEAEVFKFEFRLLRKLLGDPYNDLVGKVSESIADSLSNPNVLFASYNPTNIDRKIISDGLDTSNDQEVSFWLDTVVKFHGFWEYFREHYNSPEAEFAQFLKFIYAQK